MPSATTSPSLPTPSTFDILPPLHSILTRLLLPPTTNPPSHPQPQSNATSPPPTTSPPADPPPTSTDHLPPKNILTATTATRLKIQKARAVVAGMPDVERGVEEQEIEIGELEGEVRRLRGVLGALRGEGEGG